MTTSITAAELNEKLKSKQNICLLDVRRRADYEQSPETIAGATWHDPEQVAEWSGTLPADKDLVVYCVRGGSVSQSVVKALQESHPNVRFLEGGIIGWQDAGK
jgi:rhodanese-related sulfurtransferase